MGRKPTGIDKHLKMQRDMALIQEIEKHPELYDKSNPQYHQTHVKKAAWKNIYKIMNKKYKSAMYWRNYKKIAKVEELKKIWRNLVDQRNRIKKVETVGSKQINLMRVQHPDLISQF